MEIIPAIDLMDGKMVRLIQGDPRKKTLYGSAEKIINMIEKLSKYADRIQFIDLDATLGKGSNLEFIEKLTSYTNLPIQIGGGLRSEDLVRRVLDKGINRVILGSLAVTSPETIKRLVENYDRSRIVVSIDNLKGNIYTEGWKKRTSIKIEQGVKKFEKLGCHNFLVTAIEKDGTLSGTDIPTLSSLTTNFPNSNFIAAGGISTIDDLEKLKNLRLSGIVLGKALYDEILSIKDVKRVIKGCD